MNIFILKILLSQIIGIILGLYFKNIALFVYILLIISYLIFIHKKLIKFKKEDIFLIVLSVIIFISSSFTDEKYETLYAENINISGIGEIVSFAEETEYKNRYIIKINQINNDKKYRNTKLILYLDKETSLEYGDIIYFYDSSYERALGTRNDKCFNYERYLRQSKIYGILNIENYEIISQNRGLEYKLFKFKDNLKNSLYEMFSTEDAGFLVGLLLGDQSNISEKIDTDFQNSSLSHVLAISGMHIVYIVVAIKWILDKFINSKKIKNIILIIFLAFFAVFTGGAASCIRACIMMIIILISEIIYRRNDFFTTWCFSLIFILFLNFYNIENIGMWLSFMCVLGMNKINLKDSFAVQIMIFPIILYSYNTISFTFFISNFFASFIIGPILILGYLSLVIGKAFRLIIIIEELLLKILYKIAEIVGNFSLSKIYVISPNVIFFVIYYLVLFFIIFVPKEIKEKFFQKIIQNMKIIKNIAVALLIIFILISVLKKKEIKINFLDVSQGDCTLVTTKTGKTILVDGGDNENYDYGESVVLPYLLKHGINSVDYIMVSHFDSDHSRWIILCNTKFECRKYYNWISI